MNVTGVEFTKRRNGEMTENCFEQPYRCVISSPVPILAERKRKENEG
jgi:hypothetical protein